VIAVVGDEDHPGGHLLDTLGVRASKSGSAPRVGGDVTTAIELKLLATAH
jgi:hypothetical protein